MRRSYRFSSLLWVAFLTVSITACDSDSNSSDSVNGVYTLVSVNGEGLPYSFDNEFGTTTLQSATIRLDESGAIGWRLDFTLQRPNQEPLSTYVEEASGSYTLNGSAFDPAWVESGPIFFDPVVSDGTIELTINWYPDIDLALRLER